MYTGATPNILSTHPRSKDYNLSHYFDFFVLKCTKNSSITFHICMLRYLTMQLTELYEADKKALVLIMKSAQILDKIYCHSSLSQQYGFKRLAEGGCWCIKTGQIKMGMPPDRQKSLVSIIFKLFRLAKWMVVYHPPIYI